MSTCIDKSTMLVCGSVACPEEVLQPRCLMWKAATQTAGSIWLRRRLRSVDVLTLLGARRLGGCLATPRIPNRPFPSSQQKMGHELLSGWSSKSIDSQPQHSFADAKMQPSRNQKILNRGTLSKIKTTGPKYGPLIWIPRGKDP